MDNAQRRIKDTKLLVTIFSLFPIRGNRRIDPSRVIMVLRFYPSLFSIRANVCEQESRTAHKHRTWRNGYMFRHLTQNIIGENRCGHTYS